MIKAPPAEFNETAAIEEIAGFASEEGYPRGDRAKVVQQLLAVARGMRRAKIVEALEGAKGKVGG